MNGTCFYPYYNGSLSAGTVRSSLASCQHHVSSLRGIRSVFGRSFSSRRTRGRIRSVQRSALNSVINAFRSFYGTECTRLENAGTGQNIFRELHSNSSLFSRLAKFECRRHVNSSKLSFVGLVFGEQRLVARDGNVISRRCLEGAKSALCTTKRHIVIEGTSLLGLLSFVRRIIGKLLSTGPGRSLAA